MYDRYSKNKLWTEIADKYWTPYLKDELDSLFPGTVPVLQHPMDFGIGSDQIKSIFS